MTTLLRSFAIENARVCDADGSNPVYLTGYGTASNGKTITGTITFDATWSPFVQATLVAALPSTADMNLMDPRAGKRVRFTHRQTEANGTTKTKDYDLVLRSRPCDYAAGTVTVNAASDESLWQDYARGTARTYPSGSYNSADLVVVCLGDVGATITTESGAPTTSMAADDVGQDVGVTTWDYVSQIVEAAGAWVYVDETRAAHYALPGWTPTSSTYSFSDDRIVNVVDDISRDSGEWANFVVVAYTGNSPTQYVYDTAGSSTRKTLVVTRSRRKPAGNAATKIRTAAMKRGRSLQVTAIADIALRPNRPVAVTFNGATWNGTVQKVDFALPDGLMNLTVNVTES